MSLAQACRTCAAAQARAKQETADRDDAELLRWLLDQGLDFIGLHGGSRAALIEARQDAHTALPPSAVAIGADLDANSIEQGEPA